MRPNFPLAVDPPFPAGGNAAHQLQRAGLALDGNEIVIGYGGNDGDCGTYWGWLVAAPTSGVGPTYHFQVEEASGHHAGAIWGSGNAPAIDAGGNVYAATGNGYSGGTFDYSESVLRLEPSLHLVEYWAPAEWLELDEHDGDLGSSNPMVLPNGLVFEIGKSGEAVLLRPGAFGGVGATPAASISVCGSWGGGIYVPASAEAGTLYVSCLGGGLRAVSVRELNAAEPKLSAAPGWSVPSQAIGPPIFAGDLVWATHWNEDVSEGGGVLYGINPTTGHVQFEEPLGAFEHFATPSAGGGRLFVANNAQVTAFGIAIPPAPSATSTLLGSSANPSLAGRGVGLSASVSPVPDSGSVAFTDGGVPIPGCAAVAVSLASSGAATCATSFAAAGNHPLLATYYGDPYYTASASAPLVQVVQGVGSSAAPAISIQGVSQSHARWREGSALAQVSRRRSPRRLPVGTTFSFTLNAAASVSLLFTQSTRGQKAGRRCLSIPHHRPSATKRLASCVRTVTVAALLVTGHAGADHVRFDGRVSRRKRLRPGRYTLLLHASNASGNTAVRGPTFTIVKG